MSEEKAGSAAGASPGSERGSNNTYNDINHHHNTSCARYNISGNGARTGGEGGSEAVAFHSKTKRIERFQKALGQEGNKF